MNSPSVEVPEWGECLWDDTARHIGLHGGRGSAKSRTIATALVIQGSERPKRILCAREIQRSIRDSVKRLLDDTIMRCGLGNFYQSTDREIRGANGTLFIFGGLRSHVEQIKSIEGLTDAWIEEARTVSQESIDVLEPTVRMDGSRLIWSWNPKFPTDPVDAMFRGNNLDAAARASFAPPPRSRVLEVNPDDNPWFPKVLREKMEHDRLRDRDKYNHIWRGAYWLKSEAKVFKNWEEAYFETPEDAILRFGADWGFSVDPTVLVRCFIGWWDGQTATADPMGNTVFIDREAWEVGCKIENHPALFAGTDHGRLEARWENPLGYSGIEGASRWPITADSARPELIRYMRDRGFNIEPAIKGPGSIEDGVEFLQSYNIVIHPRCTNVIDEISLYSYKTDKLTGKVLPILEDKDNNTIDAARYALEAARRAGSGKLLLNSASPRSIASGHNAKAKAEAERAIRTIEVTTANAWGTVPGGKTGIL